MDHELRRSAWLAGFIDGEGHLAIAEDARHDNRWPVLEVTQRDDDLALVERIAAALGGCVKRKLGRHMAEGYRQKPQARVTVASKVGLFAVVAYLDTFPLRTKKAAEYAIWREAVLAYVEDGGKSPALVEAKMRLQSLKTYRAPLALVA